MPRRVPGVFLLVINLSRIGEEGLLSYSDYCFLLSLLSTPKRSKKEKKEDFFETLTSRFIETAFNLFDVTGDGHINAKVLMM